MSFHQLPENPNSKNYKLLYEYYKSETEGFKVIFYIFSTFIFALIVIIVILISENDDMKNTIYKIPTCQLKTVFL